MNGRDILLRICVFALALFACRATLAVPEPPIQLVTRWAGDVPKLTLSPAERAWLKEHSGVIRVGVLKDEAVPLDIVDAARNYQGISAEYVGILAAALHVRIEIEAFEDHVSLMDALAAGKVDLVTAAHRTGGRSDFIYSRAYFGNRVVVASRVEDPGFAIKPSANASALAYVHGTVDESKLHKAYPDVRLLELPSLTAALYAVAFGEAEACVGNAAALNDLIEWHQLLNVSVTDVARFAAEDFRFATVSGNRPLMDMVSQMLQRVREGDRDVIRALWEGFGTHYTIGSAISLSEAERQWIATHPVVRYAMRQRFSPFITENEDGMATGFGVDLLDMIGRQTGLRFEPAPVDAVTSSDGEVMADIIVAASPSDPALSDWAFTAPYSETPEVIVARSTHSYHGVASLQGKSVVIGPGTSISRDALQKAGARIIVAKTVWSASDLLMTGIADAWITNATTANYITQFQERLAIVGETRAGSASVAFAIRPESAALTGILNDGLASISASRMHSLRDKWQFSRQVRTPWDKRRPLILTIGLGTLVLVVLFLVWNSLLRKEIRRRKRAELDLAAAIQVAEDASRAKSTFLATMSHEIRTPMNAVLGVLELLKQSRGTIDSQFASIDAAYESARALLSLIEDILDLSKIESGKLELAVEPTDCDALVRSVANVFGGLARQRHIRFSLEIDNPHQLGATIDPIRLRQILSNLLSNAVKFTPSGEVALKSLVRADEGGNVRIVLSVIDTGIGMSSEEQAKLFQPFVQADRTIGARFGGSGLGLAICRRLVELMGGALELTSAPGAGTSVEVTVLAPQAAIVDAGDMSSEPIDVWCGRFRSYSALIVDDHPANRLVLSRQLEYLGFEVVCAQDGAEALECMSSTQFDIVVTDLFMAGMTGYELAQEIRNREAVSGRSVLLIGCTANAQLETLRRGLAAGMDICVTKPLGLAALAKRLTEWLAERATDAEAQLSPAPQLTGASDEAWIDSAAVERIVSGDRALELKLLDTIVTANRETLDELRRAAADNDRDGFCAASHRVRGGIRLLGAALVVQVCEDTEAKAMDAAVPLAGLLPAIESHVERLNAMLDARMAGLRGMVLVNPPAADAPSIAAASSQ